MTDWKHFKNAMRERRQMERQKRLEEANDKGWSKHTKYHWYMILENNIKLDYWPSTGKYMVLGRVFRYNTLPFRVKEEIAAKQAAHP